MPRQVVPPSKFPLLKRHAISRWRQAILLLAWHHVPVLAEMFVLPLAFLSSVFLSHSWGGFGSCTGQMQSSLLFSSRGMWGLCKKLSGRGSAFCLALLCLPKICSSSSLRVPLWSTKKREDFSCMGWGFGEKAAHLRHIKSPISARVCSISDV